MNRSFAHDRVLGLVQFAALVCFCRTSVGQSPNNNESSFTSPTHLEEMPSDCTCACGLGSSGVGDTHEPSAALCRVTVAESLPWDPEGPDHFPQTDFGSTEFRVICTPDSPKAGSVVLPPLPPHVPADCGYALEARWSVECNSVGARVDLAIHRMRDGWSNLWVDSQRRRDADIVCDQPLLILQLVCD